MFPRIWGRKASEFAVRNIFFSPRGKKGDAARRLPELVQTRGGAPEERESLFSTISDTIGIRIRSWEEVRYSNELANLLPGPCGPALS